MTTQTWAIIILVLLSGVRVRAQNTDSLKKELARTSSASVRSGILYLLGIQHYDKDEFDTSVEYFKRSIETSRRAGYDTMYMESCGFLSAVLRQAKRNNESLLYADTAIARARSMHLPMRMEDFLVEKSSTLIEMYKDNEVMPVLHEALGIALAAHNKNEEARIYWILAIYYDDLANYAVELNYVNQAVVIFDSLKIPRRVADAYRFLAQNFGKRDKWPESLHYARMADSMYAKLGMAGSRNAMKLQMALDYRNLGNTDLAISLYRACLDSFRNDEYERMYTYAAYGVALSSIGSFDEARKAFEKALLLNRKFKEPGEDVGVYTDLCEVFLKAGQSDSALYYAKLSENVCKQNYIGLDLFMQHTLQVRNVYEARKEFAEALTYDKRYVALQDSMYRGLFRNNLADADARFNLTEKNKELSELSAENELQRVKAQKQTLLNIFLLLGLCLGGVIVGLIISVYRRTLKQNRLLAEQKQELQQQKDIIDTQVIQLAGAAKMKSKFLANISHELRTPVTLLSGMLEMMTDGKKQSPAKAKARLDIAYRNSRTLQHMVEEILELTKLENNKSEPVYETREAGPLVMRIVYAFETLIERQGLALEYNDSKATGLYISIDTGKFEKVINNLLYNAIKFNKEHGRIWVSLYPDVDSRHLCIEVTDSGSGISATDLPHIFDHFYQGETKGVKAAGAGIGLSLVKEFTMLMGGAVHVHSTSGKGTTFTLQYPLAVQPEAEAREQEERPGHYAEKWALFARRQNALIVEDNGEMRYYLQEVLGEYVNITTAGNGHEGMACLELSLPDVIISDVMMPGMDGREFVNQIKAQDRYRKIPVITLTALADMDTQLSFLRLGVDDYIVKPFNADELRIRVYNLLVNLAERQAFVQEPSEVADVIADNKEAEEFRGRVTTFVAGAMKNVNLSVNDLAYELALSERQLYRLSKSLTGYSPAQLIKEVRLQKAYELLLSGDIYKIEDVCRRVGYEKASYFAQQFYERFGKRPSEFL